MAQNKVKHKVVGLGKQRFYVNNDEINSKRIRGGAFWKLVRFFLHISKTMCGWQKKPSLATGKLEKFTSGVRDQLLAPFFVVPVVLWLTKQEQEADNLFVDKGSTRGLNQQGNPRMLQVGLHWLPASSSALPQLNFPGSVITLGRSWHHWCSWHH